MTSPNARRLMGRLLFQKSVQTVFHAAEYSSGGKKIRNTRSGLSRTSGIPGIRLINKPPITRKMGYDIFNLLLTIVSIVIVNKSANTSKRLSCIKFALVIGLQDK